MSISLVQVAQNHSSTDVHGLTVTLGTPATAGNCLVACISGYNCNTVEAVTSSASQDQWGTTAAVTADSGSITCEIWVDAGCAGGNTTVNSTVTNSGLLTMQVFEWSGIAASSAVDVTTGAVNIVPTNTTWTSGTSGTYTAGDLLIGACSTNSGVGVYTVSGPSSPWTNETPIATSQSSISIWTRLICGYQITSGSGTMTYAGTATVAERYGGAAVALKPAGGGGGGGSAGSFLEFFS